MKDLTHLPMSRLAFFAGLGMVLWAPLYGAYYGTGLMWIGTGLLLAGLIGTSHQYIG